MVDIKVGDKLKILCEDFESRRFNIRRRVIGKVIYKNNDYFTLMVERNGEQLYRESFMYKDKLQIQKC